MKLYIVVGGWDWEGKDEPEGIFSTREKATAFAAIYDSGHDLVEIYEYDLDVPGSKVECR
jgi:hypothetical protein